ncbi:3-chlorobenzoate- -dioxygenase oxygenase subunit [Lasius niger]|uniref:3-chlorobenzoate--dioxygenase oxygenase subunit n=2 Tax=Lasius TaxID=488720 RepID=A0A0J7L126_LASNI|nr:3-chlorobenzoate- -dioxygenase oxygenase subunit [Lasius niger]
MFLSGVPWLAQHSWITNVPWRPHCSYSETDVDKETDAVAKKAEVRVKVNGELTDYPIAGNGDEKNRHHFTVAENEGIGRREKHKAGLQMRHSLTLLERFTMLVIDVRVEQIGPGYVELSIDTSFGPMCILQTVTPIEPMLQRVTHQIFSPPLLAPYANLIFLGECVMFERDIVIWNHKRFERQPMLVSEERAIREYRRWYSQFYSDHSPTYQTAVENLQW